MRLSLKLGLLIIGDFLLEYSFGWIRYKWIYQSDRLAI